MDHLIKSGEPDDVSGISLFHKLTLKICICLFVYYFLPTQECELYEIIGKYLASNLW